jgi:hypothetical protein
VSLCGGVCVVVVSVVVVLSLCCCLFVLHTQINTGDVWCVGVSENLEL